LKSEDLISIEREWLAGQTLDEYAYMLETKQQQEADFELFQSIGRKINLFFHKLLHQQQNTYLPWQLCCLLFGYIPIGLNLYLTHQEISMWVCVTAMAISISIAVIITRFIAAVIVWAWVVTMTWTIEMILTGSGSGIWTVVVAWIVIGAGAATVVLTALRVTLAEAEKVAMISAVLVGGTVGYFSGLGAGVGIAIGLLSYLQSLLITIGLIRSGEELKKRYQKLKSFIILGGVSCLGIAIGGVIGWSLISSGIYVPKT
ncbi:MAG: hypothetical protein AAF572_28080, partial [Cyanobacteria bacterium P01_B01_bin.77]